MESLTNLTTALICQMVTKQMLMETKKVKNNNKIERLRNTFTANVNLYDVTTFSLYLSYTVFYFHKKLLVSPYFHPQELF